MFDTQGSDQHEEMGIAMLEFSLSLLHNKILLCSSLSLFGNQHWQVNPYYAGEDEK